jgi:hypothetical protein
MGRVWMARDTGLDRDVALKELHPELAENPSLLARFLREARITGQLEHPGIVPVYELARSDDPPQPFYTMRFVRGRTLTQTSLEYHQKRAAGADASLDLAVLLHAQDTQGNVWYFGEITKEYENGKVTSREGSWLAGVRNALPGIVMEAQPQVGDSYFQENAPNVAQDMATVLDLHAKFTAPYGTFKNCLQTQESSPLEPGFVENKYYLPGVGFLGSVAVQGGDETLSLVSVMKPE